MSPSLLRLALLATAAASFPAAAAAAEGKDEFMPRPAALQMKNVPEVPRSLAERVRPYLEYRTATFAGWNSADKSMLIATRFGNTSQLHSVKAPGAARTQISFEEEPVGGSWSPAGDVLLVSKDKGGDEFYQLYTLKDGRLTLLTDGKSRNEFGAWSPDGKLIGYSSTRRNGTDTDLYVMDPRDPRTDRRVAELKGGGWNLVDFSPDSRSAVVGNYVSATETRLFLLDLASGALKRIDDPRDKAAYGSARFAPDGTIWVLSDRGSDFQRLGTLDPGSGRFTPRGPKIGWDIEEFELSSDGRSAALLGNEAGYSRLYLLDIPSGAVRRVAGLPNGVASGLDIAPWGAIGLTLSSARVPADAYSVDPASLAITRWTMSETGGLDPARNAEPELIEVTSFDGEKMSGFLYRPDPARFPGKRPLLMWIHGGPESQDRPAFRGRYNYLMNELGIALFYPNVRGSSGYGKRFINLDNGPFLRENSVRDIGAFLARLKADPGIDGTRIAETGRSYGGYMCYASAIMFGAEFKSANCVVPISDFVTFLNNTQSYRRDLRRAEYGDERDPRQLAQFRKIAPMRRITEIKVPLYVVAGENDPRVPASEARQVYEALNGRGTPVWLNIAQNEGHVWGKKENIDYQFWTDLLFWQETLLGQ